MSDDIFSKYNRKEITGSKYYYQDSEVLINKLNIRDPEVLSSLEADLTSQRLSELFVNPVKGRFGVSHIINVHKYIFQDIFPFAGKIREEDIWKGDTFFCKSQFIYGNLEELLKCLKNEKYLKNLKVNEFSGRAAFFMAELNVIHPFREGNGRVIREFVRCLALKNTYFINWSLIDNKELLDASILSASKVLEPLTHCLYQAIENK